MASFTFGCGCHAYLSGAEGEITYCDLHGRAHGLLTAGAEQLDDWAGQFEREPVLRHLPLVIGIIAGMREVAADYRRVL